MQLVLTAATILGTAAAVLGAHASCTDHYPEECARWEGMGECKAIKKWMSKHCPKSCKICNAESACSDTKKACENWAKKGLCESSKDYMSKSCPLSCKVCKPTVKKTATKTETKCVDRKPKSCHSWAEKGECEGSNKGYMLENCKKSCGGCGGKTTPVPAKDCVDTKPKSCHNWAVNGECEGSNKDYMLENCKKSCKVCTGSGETISAQVATVQKGADRQKADHNEKAKSTTVCVDKKPKSCHNWAANGECEGSNKDYMLANCKKSCKVCTGSGETSSAQVATAQKGADRPTTSHNKAKSACFDKKPKSCHNWAEHGECEGSNKDYMLENCRKSCKVCGGADTTAHGSGDHAATTTECVDKKPTSCHSWAERGECGGSNKDYMHEFCRKSCKLCLDDSSAHDDAGGDESHVPFSAEDDLSHGSEQATCADSQTDCHSWAKAGECSNNAQWMNENCPKSCGKCEGAGVQTVARQEEEDEEEEEEEEEVAAPLPKRSGTLMQLGDSVKDAVNGGLQKLAGGLMGIFG